MVILCAIARRCKFLPAVLALPLLFSASARANAPDHFDLSPEQLFSATVISAAKAPTRIMDTSAAVYVLTGRDIARSGATSIPEALRLAPGVNVARVNGNSWAISIRGFNGTLANKLLVLMDGREVYDPLFSGVYWDVQDTPLEDIERIEVIRGPGASLWGANAVNGVINIITRDAADTQGGLASALAGNKERTATARYGARLGETGHWRVYGKYLDRDDEPTPLGRGDNDEWRAKRGGFRGDWKTAAGHATFQGDAYRSDAGQMRYFSSFTPPLSPLREEELEAYGGNLLGRWTQELGNKRRFTLQTYVDHASRNQLLIKNRRTRFDADAQYEFPLGERHSVVAGGRYRLSLDDLTQTTTLVSFRADKRHDQLFSGFVQDKITLEPERWFLTLGSKLEHNDYTGVEIQPTARMQWHPAEDRMAWASISRAVRSPSRLEHDLDIVQAVSSPIVSLNTVPNPDFDSETLIAYELGYRQQLSPAATLDIAAFYNQYDDLTAFSSTGIRIDTPPPHFALTFAPQNLTQAETYGIETSLSWRVTPAWNLSGSYSLLKMALHGPLTGALGAEDAETQSPDQQFNLRSQWDISDRLSFDTMAYYVSNLPYYSVPDYVRLDMRLGWQVTDALQLELVGQNLLDGSHREFTALNDIHSLSTEVERSVYGKATLRF